MGIFEPHRGKTDFNVGQKAFMSKTGFPVFSNTFTRSFMLFLEVCVIDRKREEHVLLGLFGV